MPTETKPTAVPLTKSDQVIALEEARAFMMACPNYFPCKENMHILNDYLLRHNLTPTYPNFKQAYEELTELGQLHLSTPPERPFGNQSMPKPKVKRWTGSHYDKTELDRLRAEIAGMTSRQLNEFLEVNGWSDFPLWLKAGM